MPAVMPELHLYPYPAWDEPEEIRQPIVIALLRGQESDQQYGLLAAQFVPGRLDGLQPRPRRIAACVCGSAREVP